MLVRSPFFNTIVFLLLSFSVRSQTSTPPFRTGIGVALYPTGTEAGIGIRTSKENRLIIDARIAKASFFTDKTKNSSFGSEFSFVYRVVKYEKVRFHLGVGYKAEWNFPNDHKHGVVVPIGVEAFPFPFQNAGLFFESAPYALIDKAGNAISGIRTAAGFIFYFVRKQKETTTNP